MRIAVFAVGRMKSGPERELADRYFDRFAKAARSEGLEFAGVTEITESRGSNAQMRSADEAQRLLQRIPAEAKIIVLDETGKNACSAEISSMIGSMRDGGVRLLAFVIGGPDGHGLALRENAAASVSFGAPTWPHQLVRVMLAEQLYRAATIMSGHPYHRS